MSAGCHPEASGMFRRRISSRFFAKAFLLLRMTLGRERAAIHASSSRSRLPRTFAARAMVRRVTDSFSGSSKRSSAARLVRIARAMSDFDIRCLSIGYREGSMVRGEQTCAEGWFQVVSTPPSDMDHRGRSRAAFGSLVSKSARSSNTDVERGCSRGSDIGTFVSSGVPRQ